MKIKLLILLLACPAFLFAQKNYKPGYIVKSAGDTVRGYIDYRGWFISPKEIQFKTSSSDSRTELFNPMLIKGFSVSDENYVAYRGLISMDKRNTSELANGVDTASTIDTVFLRVIVRSPHFTLLRLTDHIKTRFFIQEGAGEPYELIYRRFYIDQLHLNEQSTYIEQLNLLKNKYNGDKDHIDLTSLSYNENDLVRAVRMIDHLQQTRSGGLKLSLYAGIGADYGNLKFSGGSDFTNMGGKKSVTPALSIGLQTFNNPRIQRWIFRGELDFSYLKTDITRTVVYDSFTTYSERYLLNQYTGTLSFHTLYNFYNKPNLKFFAGMGVNFNFSAYSKNELTVTSEYQVTVHDAFSFNHIWIGVPFEVGSTINKQFELYLMYVYNSAYTSYEAYSIRNETFSGGLRYHF